MVAHWGATPWTVFAQGVGHHLGVSLGWATVMVSAVVLLAWWPLRERPGLGTVANLVIIASALQVTSTHIATPRIAWMRAVLMLLGVLAIGLGSALYLTTGLGPGPRDGLMTSLHRHLRVSVVYVRLSIELTVLVAGWLLGGVVGVGTAFFAGTIGFSIGWSLYLVDRLVTRWYP